MVMVTQLLCLSTICKLSTLNWLMAGVTSRETFRNWWKCWTLLSLLGVAGGVLGFTGGTWELDNAHLRSVLWWYITSMMVFCGRGVVEFSRRFEELRV